MIADDPASHTWLDQTGSETYRALVDSIDQGFCICEMLVDTARVPYDYRFLEVNRLFEGHTGLYDAVGQTARTLVPDLEAHWVEVYGRVALERAPIRFEQASTALGRSFEVYAFPFGPAERLRFGILFTDITDRKKAEHEREQLLRLLQDEKARLRTSEERYRAIVESQTEMVCRFRPDGNILFVNAAYAQSRGTTPEHLIGHNFWEFVAAADQPRVRAQLADLTPQTPEVRIENRFHTSEGLRWLLWTNRGLAFDSAGRAIEVQSTGVDITDRKRREGHTALLADISHTLAHASDDGRIMEEVAERLGQHLHASRCVFNEYDRSGGVITVTHDWCETEGESLKGQYRLHDFFTDEALETLSAGSTLAVNDTGSDPNTRARHAHYAALDIGALVNTPYVRDGQWRGSLTVHRRAPCIWLRDEIDLMRDLSGRVWASIERSRANRRLRDSEAELRHASLLKDEFLATLSHELRTPLNAVLGWAHLLRTATLPPDVAKRGFDALERNARVQTQLVDDLLDMSRIVAGKLQIDDQPVDLPTVVAGAVETVAPTAAAKGVSLTMAGSDSGPCHVTGDADRIRQIAWNLVSNAIKFTPPGGAVAVSVEQAASTVDVVVRDTGEGIDPSFLPLVFERFRQADATTTRRHGGLGLGLAIVRHLTEAHGGTATAESPGLDRGATFRVRLPTMGAPLLRAAQEAAPAPLPEPIGARILIVDDAPDALDLFRVLLEARGARVVTALSAQEALEHLRLAPFDLMLADVGMPEQDGLSLVQALRHSQGPNAALPAVAVTAFAGAADRERALQAGYQEHVAKPVEPEHLLRVIGTVLGRAPGSSDPV